VGGFGPLRRLREEHAGRSPLSAIGQHFADQQGIAGDGSTAATALRKLSWQTVATIGKGREEGEGFEPVVDGISLLDDTQAIFKQGRQHPVPFIAGFNSFEGNLTLVFPWTDEPPRVEVEKRIDRLAPLYGRKPDDKAVWDDLYGDVYFGASTLLLVREMEQVKTPAWTYHFDYVRGRGRNSRGAGHGSEVTFVFDSVILPGANERKIIDAMQGHWIQFAKTGDPNGPGLTQWPGYTSCSPTTLVIGQERIRSERDWLKPRMDLLFEAIAATWSPDGALIASKSAATSSGSPSVPKPAGSVMLDAASEKVLRERVAALFDALIAGDIDKCLELSDPTVVKEKGRENAVKFFKGDSGLVKFAKIQAKDRVIKSITPLDEGKSAKVEIELTLKGKKQPPGFEIWGLVDGEWRYQETTK
jgi:hypothetical protein